MSRPIVLEGLDGSNPLGFFAALGVLRVLDDAARREGRERPRLAWCEEGRWRPHVFGMASIDEVIDTIVADGPSWVEEPILTFAYDSLGQRVEPGTKGAIRDLKPRPEVMRAFLAELASAESRGRSADLLAALATEITVDQKGNVKPTAFHFTAGQQTFLEMVAKLREGLVREHFVEALVGPWRRASRLPTLKWDASAPREYALRATNPAGKGEKPQGVPGADWLAFLALSFFPVAVRGKRLATACVTGGWKRGTFSWPLWVCPAGLPAVRSLLASWGEGAEPGARTARGVAIAFRSRIRRSDQGGYGSFSPAEPF